jgi:ribosomal protein S12 methylthiotransferase
MGRIAPMNCNIYLVSLGCPKNQVDAEAMLWSLTQAGCRVVGAPEEADVVVVNTCGFITDAKTEAVDTILEMARHKKSGRRPRLVVSGCLSQRYPDEIARELPEVDCVLGVTQYPDIVRYVQRALAGERIVDTAVHTSVIGCAQRVLITPPHMAYIKIAEGCDNRCSYCAIPAIRGRYRSRPLGELIGEAGALAARGVRELIVTAQDTTRYGIDRGGKPALAELLRALCGVPELKWIRVLYTYPELVDRELAALLEAEPRLCAYLDIPLQHISDPVLSAMNRRSSRSGIKAMYAMLRGLDRHIALRTTYIVGFPGETEPQFRELLSFVEDHPFDHVGAFRFSPEDGTAAARMRGQVSGRIKRERLDRLMEAQQRVLRRWNRRHIGRTYEVLVEGIGEDGLYEGRTEYQAPGIDSAVRFRSGESLSPGMFVRVAIESVAEYDWIGVHADDAGK